MEHDETTKNDDLPKNEATLFKLLPFRQCYKTVKTMRSKYLEDFVLPPVIPKTINPILGKFNMLFATKLFFH